MSIVRTAYAFTPTAISNCALWLDGADSSTMFQNTGATTPITADGQTIAAWKDKSTNAYVFTQPTAGNQPTYKVGIQNGCSLTRWNGTSTGLQSSTTLPFYTSASSGGSFFFVFMITNNSSQRFLMTYQNQTSGTFCVSESEIGCPTGNVDTGNFGIHQGCSKANVALNQITTNTYVLMNLNLLSSGTAPANTTIYKNGSSSTVTAQNGGFYSGTTYPNTNNARYLNIGYRVPVGTYPIDCWLAGDIAEIIWYQNPVTDAQRQTIEGYLAQKWGLTSSLAAGHPGLTTRVYRSDYLVPNKVKPTPYYTFFSPRQIPGLVVWLDGADPAGNGVIPANGSTVSTWTDKSGNGNNGTAVNTPTYALSSKGVATSSGAYFTLPNGAFPFNDSSYTYFFVFTTTTTGSVNSLFGGGVPGSTRSTVAVRLGTNGANNVIQTYWWSNGIGDLLVSNTYTANTISIAETWYATGGTRTITLNFAGSSTDSPAASGARLQANTNNYLGLAYPGDGALTGFHYEFLVYNTSLSTSQRQQVESYLAQKWGLTASIPVGHSHLTQQAGAVTTTALSKFKVIGLPLASLQIPQTIAGLAMWLDATKITGFANGATLTSWTDSIGSRSFSNVNGVTYQTSIINGLPAVYMNGPGPYLEYSGSPPTLVSGGTIYGVVQNDADGLVQPNYSGLTFQVLWQINGYANGWEGYPYNFNYTTQLGTLATTRRAWAYPFSSTYFKSPHIVKVVSTTNSWIQSFIQTSSSTNSSYTDTSASTPTLISPMRLGACMDGPGLGYYKGYFAEILLYNRGLNSTEQTTIENYLKAKWNV